MHGIKMYFPIEKIEIFPLMNRVAGEEEESDHVLAREQVVVLVLKQTVGPVNKQENH